MADIPVEVIVAGLVAFAVVAGWALLRWAVAGRDPTYLDDPSILLPAPPPGMTAATGTVIAGGDSRVAFLAALLDLASRDEIAFRDEGPGSGHGGARSVGIEFHGGTSTDPHVLLNRRLPIGEGEAWLLTLLKMFALHGRTDLSADVEQAVGVDAMTRFLGFVAPSPDGARPTPQGGMLSALPDPQALMAAAAQRSGRALTDEQRHHYEQMAPFLGALANPAAISADPDAFIDQVASARGVAITPEQRTEFRTVLEQHFAPATVAEATAARDSAYLTAAEALHFSTPFGFGTFLERYAQRQGWLAGLSVFVRLKWRALAVVEVVLGLVLVAIAGKAGGPLAGAGYGVAAGGIATWFIGGWMARRTQSGAVMRAQLAAYRRTLQSTLAGSPTIEAAVGTPALPWLDTTDRVLTWGVALGLRSDLEAALNRTGAASAGGSAHAFLPAWWHGSDAPSTAAAAMFEGIAAIGSRAAERTPARSG